MGLAARYDNLMPDLTLSPQSGSMNSATFSTLIEEFQKCLIFSRNRLRIMYLLKQNLCSFPLELGEPSICLLINLCPDLKTQFWACFRENSVYKVEH